MPATATEDSPTAMMTARIERAVESGEGSVELLEQWLQGFDLPPLGVDEEPYVWILRGHAEAVERVQAEKALAVWLAELFEKKPDVEPLSEFPDRLLFNAFLLAAGLASPDELWEPLLAIYERRELRGDYLGLDHRSSLRSALSQNQLDARLEPVWRAMATGKETDFLPGNAYNGFEALAMMPDPEKGRGHPALEALGKALTYLVMEVDGQPRLRDRRFERLLIRLRGLYPGREGRILGHISHVAKAKDWPIWAAQAVEASRSSDCGRVSVASTRYKERKYVEEPQPELWAGTKGLDDLKSAVVGEVDDIDEAADLMRVAGSSTSLRLLYLLDIVGELCAIDLAELLNVSILVVSQHLSKLKEYGLVTPRRDAETIYYRLTDHTFNTTLHESFFRQFQTHKKISAQARRA